jgi:serine protease Do
MPSLARFAHSTPAWIASFLFLLAGPTVWAQEVKPPDAKPPMFVAPELKPLTAKLPAAFSKPAPESVEELKAIQEHVAKLVENVMPAVVSVRVGASFGSGVIVSKDGFVLTAGHVSGTPGRDVKIYFHDGTTADGKTLGGNHGIDSGMIKITTKGDWPFVDMGDASTSAMKPGDWCMVVAHPGGFKKGRTPPVRLGRLLKTNDNTLTTDCILVGGDSGGPLFDMHGRVVGINSRIGEPLSANMHVPVNPFRDHWDKIAKNEVWGGKLGGGGFGKGGPYLGVQYEHKADGCVVLAVRAGSGADKAGVKVNDVILKFDAKDVTDDASLPMHLRGKKIGDQVVLEIRRGAETLNLKVELGKRF